MLDQIFRYFGLRKKQFSEKAAPAMAKRIRRAAKSFPAVSKQKAHWGIFVAPWAESAFPHFCLEIAAKLRAEGHAVTIIYDATDLSINTHIRYAREVYYLAQLMETVREVFPVVDITDRFDEAVPAEFSRIEELLRENFVCRFRGEEVAEKKLSGHPRLVESASAHAAAMEDVLHKGKFARLLIPGGFYGMSGLLAPKAIKLGIPFKTFDSSRGRVIYCHNGVAAWYEDCPKSYAFIREAVRGEAVRFDAVCEKARVEIDKRRTGRDDYRLQKSGLNTTLTERYDVVAFLNIRCDIAALDRNYLFPSVRAWLTALATWAVEKKVRLAIRQHPAESIEVVRGNDDLEGLIKGVDPEGKHVSFLKYDAPVNSYDLMDTATVILPFTSTTGVESASAGKTVIVHAKCYYRDLDFIQAANSPAEYFQLIETALREKSAPAQEQRDNALLCYAITQQLSWTFGDFTGIPLDFANWSKLPPDELWQRPDASELWAFLQSDNTMARVKYERMIAAG